ncbi:MAG: nickel-dependent lactate racemase [Phycisphaeraceae bacterium]|nr:nickel-dependent lactate racemase [Phycisphaeraceae bacterium]
MNCPRALAPYYHVGIMNPRKQVELRYGRTRLTVSVPASAAVLTHPVVHAAADAIAVVRHALRQPIASAPLEQLLRQRKPRTVAISISDITRPVPNEPIVTALLVILGACGIPDSAVVVVIATGMHRPSTPEERKFMLGSALLHRVEVIDHIADDAATLVSVSDNPPVSVNARFARADFKIVTGLIEPHFMAGYSGGRKGVCPGLVDLKTVQRFHGYRTLADPRSAEGVMTGNPCHDEAMRVANLVGVDFLVNVTIAHDRKLAKVYAGDLVAAHDAGCKDVAQSTCAQVNDSFDLVVTSGGGYPLDETVYQTSKGIVMALPALHRDSTLLIASDCKEIGSPEFTGMLETYSNDWRRFLDDISRQACPIKDQWVLQMLARVHERITLDRVCLAADDVPTAMRGKLWCRWVDGQGNAQTKVQRFIDEYLAAHPAAKLAVIPEGPYTMLVRATP